MTKKNSQLSPQELQLIEQLRQHPELMERFEMILEISANPAQKRAFTTACGF
jgi:hypothetical protein